jgi:hypothetical protein
MFVLQRGSQRGICAEPRVQAFRTIAQSIAPQNGSQVDEHGGQPETDDASPDAR